MTFELPALPYSQDALEPYISSNTLSFHHGKHHAAYVNNLNNLIRGTDYEQKTLEEIIKESSKDTGAVGIFNNAAQVWNHTFYWHSMRAQGGGEPTGNLKDKINQDFGTYEEFAKQFTQMATTQFGSGWAWLVLEDHKLKVTKTGNADLPMIHGQTALVTCDVWEHAYYLDYQNRRPDYIGVFLDKLVNWEFVQQNFAQVA